MSRFFFFVCVLLLSCINTIQAQDDWVEYVSVKDKGLMSVSLDLSLDLVKPRYKNLLIVGGKFKNCLKNGFPAEDSLEEVFAFSDATLAGIDKITENRLAGYITFQCMAFDIFYVKDTVNLREELNKIFETDFVGVKTFIDIKRDNKWAYYGNFLYPRTFSSEFLIDQDYLYDLVLQGDDLQGLRKVNHWIYFKSLEKRNSLGKTLKKLEFSLDSIAYKKEKDFPFQLTISRQDSILPMSIYELTTMLRNLSGSVNAFYDGWSTEVKPK